VFEILFSLRLPAEERLAWAYEAGESFEERGEEMRALKYFELVASEDPAFRDAPASSPWIRRGRGLKPWGWVNPRKRAIPWRPS